jgi:hypothetical protein
MLMNEAIDRFRVQLGAATPGKSPIIWQNRTQPMETRLHG